MAVSAEDSINAGPIAPERNPPIEAEFYSPSRFVIEAISYGKTTTITTAIPHNYVKGQLVKFLIPQYYGARQLNNRQGYVIAIPSVSQVVVNIISLSFSPFGFVGVPAPYKNNVPQIIAVGDINNGVINSNGRVMNGTYVPGAFIDIS